MKSTENLLERWRTLASILIYSSVVLGTGLLAQLYTIVPGWLFFSVLAGWIVYLLVGVAAAFRCSAAYPISLVLAVLTLVVSLPEPEHYSFGATLASLTFVLVSIVQIGVIVSVANYLLKKRGGQRQTR